MIDPSEAFRVDGKVALVTGGTRGIGRAIAESLVAGGARVCVLARKPDELSETEAALSSIGGPVTTVAGSMGDPAVIERAVGHTVETLGGLDIVVNNAAANPAMGPLVDSEPGPLRKTFEVNVEGPLWLVQHAWRAWMRERGGVVLNVASIGGLRPGAFIGVYNTSKAALIHMSRQLAQELAPGVRVNVLVPGLVKTDFARALWEGNEEGLGHVHPLGRIGVPDDLAAAAVFLCSDASSWMTGQLLVVDGGTSVA